MRFASADLERVREILVELATASRREPGCVTYIPHFVDGDACSVMIYEQYRDEAAADAHRATVHFKQYAVGGLYQLMLERQVENLAAVI